MSETNGNSVYNAAESTLEPRSHEVAPDENFLPSGLPGGFFIYNAFGDEEILCADQNVVAMFGCTDIADFREYTNNCFSGMVHPDDLVKIQNDIKSQTINSERRHDYVRYRIVTKQGEVRYVEDFGHLLHGADGRAYFYVYIVDVDADEYYNRNSNSLAETAVLSAMNNADRLTGLLNVSSFHEAAQVMFDDESLRAANKLFMVYFDIANFKIFNEKYGYERGDDLLCRVAFALSSEFEGDEVARFSEDHFVVLTRADNVIERVERVHSTMAGAIEGVNVKLKAGIYEVEEDCKEASTACDRARMACNSVKRRYEKVYGLYDGELYESLRLQNYIVESVDDALANNYIKVYYQPIIRVSTGKICAYEALARWDDPRMGFLPPGKFILALEESHLIHKVDSFVLEQVCKDLRMLMDAGEPVSPVSINLSRLDFELNDVFALCQKCRQQYGVPVNLLDMEITESALNDDSSLLQDVVLKLRNAGYRVWIDDFGSGYSSLNNLMDYGFDVLKLDLEFLRTFEEHPRAGELINHIVKGARALGVDPLQEGVETQQQFDFLQSIGCECVQGYYFARPMELQASRDFTRAQGLEWE